MVGVVAKTPPTLGTRNHHLPRQYGPIPVRFHSSALWLWDQGGVCPNLTPPFRRPLCQSVGISKPDVATILTVADYMSLLL